MKSKNSKTSSRLPQSRLQLLWQRSQTKLWAYIQGTSAALLAAIPGVNTFVNSSEFNKVLSTLTVPWYVYTGIAVFGVITYIVHGHGEDA